MSILMMTLAQTMASANWSCSIWELLVQEGGAEGVEDCQARGRPLGGGPLPRDGRLRIAREDAAEQAAIQQAAVLVTMIAEDALAEQAAIFWAALRAGAVREVDREARTTQWRAADGLAATVQTVVSTTVLRRRALCHVALRDGREFGEDPAFPGSKPFQLASGFVRW